MNNRRMFLKGTAAAAVLLASGAITANAQQDDCEQTGVVFNAKSPGKWAKKVGSHAPVMTVNGDKVTVETKHPMAKKHYIVRHTLVLADGTMAGSKTYYGDKDKKAITDFTLPSGYKGKITATSFCNLHDFWTSETTV